MEIAYHSNSNQNEYRYVIFISYGNGIISLGISGRLMMNLKKINELTFNFNLHHFCFSVDYFNFNLRYLRNCLKILSFNKVNVSH